MYGGFKKFVGCRCPMIKVHHCFWGGLHGTPWLSSWVLSISLMWPQSVKEKLPLEDFGMGEDTQTLPIWYIVRGASSMPWSPIHIYFRVSPVIGTKLPIMNLRLTCIDLGCVWPWATQADTIRASFLLLQPQPQTYQGAPALQHGLASYLLEKSNSIMTLCDVAWCHDIATAGSTILGDESTRHHQISMIMAAPRIPHPLLPPT